MTADAGVARGRRRAALLPLGVVLLALVVGLVVVVNRGGDGDGDVASEELVRVDATPAVRYATLAELAGASDVVVRGEVVDIARGRTVGGQPGDGGAPVGAVVSRLVTVRVDEVLAGGDGSLAPGGQVVVEEEGWLTDGRAIALNGARPPEVGDEGIWFLDAIDDPDLPLFVTVNTQGRFLSPGGGALEGTDPEDPLVQSIVRGTLDELGTEVRALAASR